MQQLDILVNRLPAPTWNKLKVNYVSVKGLQVTGSCQPLIAMQGNICLKKTAGCCYGQDSGCTVNTELEQMATGMGSELDGFLAGGKNSRLVAGPGVSKAYITLEYGNGALDANQFEIVAKENSEVTVIMTYIATANAQGTSVIRTKVLAEKGAKVHLVQVQLLGKGFRHLNDMGCVLSAGAALDLLQLQLGGTEIYNGVRTDLQGDTSNFDASIGYFGRYGQKLDMNFIANHYGKESSCNMTADGVLSDGAVKIYRGTIDFKTGSFGAQGDETESVLLLSDNVVNKSVPVILCAEEDVRGNHGANIGRLDDDLLFYLRSRGFTEQEAINMMAKAKIEALCRHIKDDKTVKLVEMYLEGVLADV